jgi:hypothetical protein
MAYESLLTVTPILSGTPISFVANAGVDVVLVLSAANTTLGAKYSDLVAKLTINTDPDSTGVGLSATAGTTSINLTLSSPSVLTTPQVWPGQLQPGSTYKSAVSSTFGVYWPPAAGIASSLWNTVISLSSNATTIVLDPTKTSNLDNFFYLTGSPDVNHQVRTTYSHARLVAYMG